MSCTDLSRIKFDEKGYKYIVEKIPGRIVKVESRMPVEENEKLIADIDPRIDLVIHN